MSDLTERDLVGKKIRAQHGLWTIVQQYETEIIANFYDGRNDRRCVITKDTIDRWIEKWGVEE